MRGYLAVLSLCYLLSRSHESQAENHAWERNDDANSRVEDGQGGLPADVEKEEDQLKTKRHSETLRGGQTGSLRRWRLPAALSAVSKLSGRRPAGLILTASVVAAGVMLFLSLRRFGETLWDCLVESVGGLKWHDGADPRSLAGSQGDEVCDRLLRNSPEGIRGPTNFRRFIRSHVHNLRWSSTTRRYLVALAVVLAILALLLARPYTRSKAEQPDAPEADKIEEEDLEWDDVEWIVAGGRRLPLAQQRGNQLTVGEIWETERGLATQDTGPPVLFNSNGLTYKVYLSEETRNVLRPESTLLAVRRVLSIPPEMVRGKWVWGNRSNRGSLLFYSGGLHAYPHAPVRYEVYLPRGTFGIHRVGAEPRSELKKGRHDLGKLTRLVLDFVNRMQDRQGDSKHEPSKRSSSALDQSAVAAGRQTLSGGRPGAR